MNHDFKYSDCSETLSWVFDFSVGFSLCCWITRCLPHAAKVLMGPGCGLWVHESPGAEGPLSPAARGVAPWPALSSLVSLLRVRPASHLIIVSLWVRPCFVLAFTSTFSNKIGVYWRNKLLCCKNGIFLTSVLRVV